MSETCKNCRKKFDFGIWITPQFIEEKVLLFCSDQCKKDYINYKLNKIKTKYPKYYYKVIRSPNYSEGNPWWIKGN